VPKKNCKRKKTCNINFKISNVWEVEKVVIQEYDDLPNTFYN